MDQLDTSSTQKVSDEYVRHSIFRELQTCVSVYETLSDLSFGFVSMTRPFVGNVDCHFFDSLAGTVESISAVLAGGRIADAYTLLRRMKDTALLQIHVMVQFEKRNAQLVGALGTSDAELDSEEFMRLTQEIAQQRIHVEEIDNWIIGERHLNGKTPTQSGSATIEELHFLFDRAKYKSIFDRCIELVHINTFRALRLNARIDWPTQQTWLEQFAQDFRDIFAWHLAYIFTLHPLYMMSSDYVDYLEEGMTPPDGSQYWVAPIVQEAFDQVVTPYRPDVTDFIKQSSNMALS